MDDFMSMLGANLRKARTRLNITQTEVAETVHLTPEVYGRMERGHMHPSLKLLVDLCHALEVTPDQLLGYAPIPTPERKKGLLNRH